jgi:hypothetical protein
MLTTTQKSFILVNGDGIDSVAKSWNDMRDYCSETGKTGKVYVVENKIPFGGKVEDIKTVTNFFGDIK